MVERKKDDVIQAADDVAVLYSWANLHGAKYRDFSASRQELRAQSRHRTLTEQEALAQEAVAAVAQENARPTVDVLVQATAEVATMAANARTSLRPEMRPLGEPKSVHQKTTVLYERMPASVPASFASALLDPQIDAPAPKAAPAIAPISAPTANSNGAAAPAVRAPAERADRYADLPRETEFRETAQPLLQPREQPRREFRETPSWERERNEPQAREPQARETEGRESFREPLAREAQNRESQGRDSQSRAAQTREAQYRESREPQYRESRESQYREPEYRESREPPYAEARYREQPKSDRPYAAQSFGEQSYAPRVERRSPEPQPEFTPAVDRRDQREQDFHYQSRPSWMSPESEASIYGVNGDGSETLQQSRERVASRWFALKGVFENSAESHEARTERRRDIRVPTIAVFSLAGGVGKTSLVATLGRSLSAMGERVLLADTSSFGLLPYYFGARDLRPGVVRTFSPPGGGTDAPVNLLNLDAEAHENDSQNMDWLADDLSRNGRGFSRILIDLATASASLTRRALRMTPTVLVPIIPDMNSIVTLSVVDGFFRNHQNSEGRPVQPYYVLNQFDPSMPLHLDVREVLRQQLGERLLPFVLRRSQAVSEALAEGMTVVDYARNSAVADDYQHLANWLRSISAPAGIGYRGMRWSER